MAATRLSFSYPEEQKNALMKLAKNDSRSLSSYVQKVLGDHIDKHAPKKKKKRKKK